LFWYRRYCSVVVSYQIIKAANNPAPTPTISNPLTNGAEAPPFFAVDDALADALITGFAPVDVGAVPAPLLAE